MSVFGGGSPRVFVDRGHDVTQTRIDFFARPWQAHRVLAHLQPGYRHTTGICCFTGAKKDFSLEEQIDARWDSRHIGCFGNQIAAVLDQLPRIFASDFVLRGARECTIAFDVPRPPPFYIFGALELLDVFFDASAAYVLDALDPSQFFFGDAVLVVNQPSGIGHGKNLRAALD